jgi:Na+/H+ antiporter NhaD/arsenite permease-like protein
VDTPPHVGGADPATPRGEQIGFWGFTRIGAPFALVSLIVASFYIWLRYFAV